MLESIKKDIETIKEGQSAIKNTISGMMNTVKGINSSLDEAEDIISLLDNKVEKNTQSQQQPPKKEFKI